MRPWLSLILLASALPAQTQTTPVPPRQFRYFYTLPATPESVVVLPKRAPVCSVPLANVLPRGTGAPSDPMAVPARPGRGARAAMRYVTPPAPPCDDGRR